MYTLLKFTPPHKMYIQVVYVQEKTDLKNTNRLLLRYGKHKAVKFKEDHGPFPAPSVWTSCWMILGTL